MELKPERELCSHCGECCKTEVCPIGEIFMRTITPPCPALVKNEKDEYWCGLTISPETTMFAKTEYAEYWAKEIAKLLENHIFQFGAGCEVTEGKCHIAV